MNHSVCTTSWCDQGTRPHERHEATLGTWAGTSHTPPRRSIVAQVVIHGFTTEDTVPMLALVDQLEQTDVDLTWDQAHELAASIIAEAARFRRLNSPQ